MFRPMRSAALSFAPPPWITDPEYTSTEPRGMTA